MPFILTVSQNEMTSRIHKIILLLVIFCTIPAPVVSQGQGPEIALTTSWQGHTRVPGWVEVEFIMNQESETWKGELQIYDAVNTVTYQTPVFLPQHSRKSFRISLLNTDGFDLTASLQTDGTEIQHIKLPINPQNNDRVCAYIGHGTLAQQSTITNCGTFLHLQSLAELPETPMVWDNVDVLIINGVNTNTLSDRQITGMIAWVASGGHLVLSGGIALNLTLASLPQTLQVAESGPINIVNPIPEVMTNTEDIASAQLNLTPGAFSLVKSAETVLAARKSVGKGLVDVIGWDVMQISGTAWLEALWSDDSVPATAIQLFGEKAISAQIGPSVYELQEIPDNPMPALWVWLIIFIVYVILIGPVTMLVIRRINNPIYAWIMIPAWIALALIVMSFILSTTYGKTFPLVHDIAFISLNGVDLPARVVQGTALTAPQSRNIIWSTSGYLRPLWGQHAADTWDYYGAPYPLIVSYQSGKTQIATNKPNGMITWGVEGIIDDIKLDAKLSLSLAEKSPIIAGSLYSEVDLTNISLVWIGSSNQTVHLAETVSALNTVAISTTMPLSPAYADPTYSVCGISDSPFREPMVKPIQPQTSSKINQSICYLTAKSSGVPFPTSDIAGAYTGESCIIQEISCPQQMPGVISTPLNGFPSGSDGGWVDTEMDIVSPYPPASTFTYYLPDYINMNSISTISIRITPMIESESQSFPYIGFSLWDWRKNEWIEQSFESASDTREITILVHGLEAERFYDADTKSIQVRLTVPDNSYPQLHLPITIEGIW